VTPAGLLKKRVGGIGGSTQIVQATCDVIDFVKKKQVIDAH